MKVFWSTVSVTSGIRAADSAREEGAQRFADEVADRAAVHLGERRVERDDRAGLGVDHGDPAAGPFEADLPHPAQGVAVDRGADVALQHDQTRSSSPVVVADRPGDRFALDLGAVLVPVAVADVDPFAAASCSAAWAPRTSSTSSGWTKS